MIFLFLGNRYNIVIKFSKIFFTKYIFFFTVDFVIIGVDTFPFSIAMRVTT